MESDDDDDDDNIDDDDDDEIWWPMRWLGGSDVYVDDDTSFVILFAEEYSSASIFKAVQS